MTWYAFHGTVRIVNMAMAENLFIEAAAVRLIHFIVPSYFLCTARMKSLYFHMLYHGPGSSSSFYECRTFLLSKNRLLKPGKGKTRKVAINSKLSRPISFWQAKAFLSSLDFRFCAEHRQRFRKRKGKDRNKGRKLRKYESEESSIKFGM